ncbi:MAG: FHA domain-containing protein [Candidatus Ratteibacteria bacterium]|nr:FHA domain-containing protein [Candidatus Ratteibacteria bacterium]
MVSKFLGGFIKNGDKGNNISSNVTQGEVKDSFAHPAVLIFEKIRGESPVYNLPNNREFFIGQDSKNDLCLEGDDVSSVHAKIRPEKDSYMLYDLASKSGLTVNWVKTSKRRLEHKDRIKIGSYNLIFEFVKDDAISGGRMKKINVASSPMTLKLLTTIDGKLEEVTGLVKDININGATIEMQKEILHKGNVIEAGISSKELQLIEVIAQVIWERLSERDGKMLYNLGLQFLEMDEKSRNILKDYIEGKGA